MERFDQSGSMSDGKEVDPKIVDDIKKVKDLEVDPDAPTPEFKVTDGSGDFSPKQSRQQVEKIVNKAQEVSRQFFGDDE